MYSPCLIHICTVCVFNVFFIESADLLQRQPSLASKVLGKGKKNHEGKTDQSGHKYSQINKQTSEKQ